MGVKVLSLFDGMACGMLAMQDANVCVCAYDAFEIDKYAMKTATHNFPIIREHGDVFPADFTQFVGYDFLVGGSPCTHWSIAQTKDRETTVSRDEKGNILLHSSGIGFDLFSQYLRALEEAKPHYFIYENNKSMSKEIRAAITECFGFEPICINSALVSAQNRQRLYWVGIRQADGTYKRANVYQPEDEGILLKDVLDGVAMSNKAHAVIASAARTTEREYFIKNQGNMCAEPAPTCVALRGRMYRGEEQHFEAREDGKTNTLTSVEKDNRVAEPIGDTEGKAYCLTSNYPGAHMPRTLEKGVRTMVAEPVLCGESVRVGTFPAENGTVKDAQGTRIYGIDGKAVTLKGNGGGQGAKTGLYAEPIKCLTDAEMDYMVRGHQEQRWAFCNKPGEEDKSHCVVANISKGVPFNVCAEPVNVTEDGKSQTLKAQYYKSSIANFVTNTHETTGAGYGATAVAESTDMSHKPVYEVKDGLITIKGKQYPIKLKDGYYIIRKLTVTECKRLQTVPEWYEFPVSDSQAYKMLGNGWTVKVISHLIRCILSTEETDYSEVETPEGDFQYCLF